MFVEAIKLKKFIDRSADYQGFCHRWNDNPLYAWQSAGFFYEINILRSTESLPIIGSSTSDRQTVDRWRFIKGSSAVTGYWPSFGQWSPDCQQIMGLVALYCLWIHVSTITVYIKACTFVVWYYISVNLGYKYYNYVSVSDYDAFKWA